MRNQPTLSPLYCLMEGSPFGVLRRSRITWLASFAFLLWASAAALFAQTGNYPGIPLNTGKQIYQAACVACHGPDGKGTRQSIAGFQKPDSFPDFTRCDQTTAEWDTDYKAVIIHGGQFRGFSQIMPSFGEALTDAQIDKVIHYIRHFCGNPHWPRAELNLPRALITEKAYPEDELAVTTSFNAQGAPGVTTTTVYEQRFGIKNQIELSVPFTFQNVNHTWYGGIGDSAIGLKREIFSSLRTGSIFTLQGEAQFPLGNKARGLGTGVTTFETFAAYGQLLPWNFFLQFQGGADLPTHTDVVPQSLFWNTVIGRNFAQNKGLGRLWSPMVEFLATRDLRDAATTDWDVLPQFEVTLSRRQHIRADMGVRIPATNTAGRSTEVLFYVLWDWQDGKVTEGW
jgi:mono/diheme cytochrome c family protein